MKGKLLQTLAQFWPKEGVTQVGEEFPAVYRGMKAYEFQGQEKQAALFETETGMIQCSSGQITKILAPAMTIGHKYWIRYEGKKQIKANQAASHQFQVFEDDGQ